MTIENLFDLFFFAFPKTKFNLQTWIDEINRKKTVSDKCVARPIYSDERYVKIKEQQDPQPQQQDPQPQQQQLQPQQQQLQQQYEVHTPTPPKPMPRRSSSIPCSLDDDPLGDYQNAPPVIPRHIIKPRPKTEMIPDDNNFFEASKDRDLNDLFILNAIQDTNFCSGEEEEEEEPEKTDTKKLEKSDSKEDQNGEVRQQGEYVEFKPQVSSSYPEQGFHHHKKTNLLERSPDSNTNITKPTPSPCKLTSLSRQKFVRKTRSLDFRQLKSAISLPHIPQRRKNDEVDKILPEKPRSGKFTNLVF